jgi:AraC-like DNA-binding protein
MQEFFPQSGGRKMSSRLDRITDWEARAVKCGYSAQGLARECEVSPRELRWYFKRARGLSPKKWLDGLRASAALAKLESGASVKAVSAEVNYKHPSAFDRFIKRVTGRLPGKILKQLIFAGIGTTLPI